MFQLDALVLLKANETKAWGTSIYSYVEASQHASLLIDLRWVCVLSEIIDVYANCLVCMPSEGQLATTRVGLPRHSCKLKSLMP